MQLHRTSSQPQPRSDRLIEATPSPLRRVLLILALTLGLAACAANSTSVLRAPQPLQVDTARLNAVVDWLKADVAKNRYPGAVVLVMRDGKVLLHQAVGWADKEHGVPMKVDSILPVASSTKLVTT